MRAGDPAAFTALYELHYDDVLRYARRRVDEQAARDVAAETFLVVWRRPGQVPGAEPLPWLYAVARKTLGNVLRARAREAALRVRVRTATVAGVPTVRADHADAVVQNAQVAEALRCLSTRDQEVLQLVAWEDLDLAAAAQVVGCSAATFAVRLHRARRRLGRLLDAPPPKPGSAFPLLETEAR
ncbi:MAG: hypothetical protein DLM59_02805 [Pseudonocardiales bacterium]|nr:MAG: hypothetical protein DLM59_02805 [Pseudonocardiales bacterium]